MSSTIEIKRDAKRICRRRVLVIENGFTIDEQDYMFVRDFLLLHGRSECDIELLVPSHVHIASGDNEHRVCELDLECYNPKAIPASIGQLDMLQKLRINGDLKIPEIGHLNNLVKMSFSRYSTASLRYSFGMLKNLTEVEFKACGPELPEEIGNLASLEKLVVSFRSNLQCLPHSIGRLKNLKEITITNHRGAFELPQEIGKLTSLAELQIVDADIKALPFAVGNCKNLDSLLLRKTTLETLPPSIGNLTSLVKLTVCNNSSLLALPPSIGSLKNLRYLCLAQSVVKELPNDIGDMTSLQELVLTECNYMESLPPSIGNLKNLKNLYLVRMEALSKLPDEIGDMTKLGYLNISETCSLKVIPPSIKKLKNLKHLVGRRLETFPEGICNLDCLEHLDLDSCRFKFLPRSIGHLKNLEKLHLRNADIEELPEEIRNLTSLKELELYNCYSLKKLPPTIGQLTNLQKLCLTNSGLEEIPDEIGNLASLWHLEIGSHFYNLCNPRRNRQPKRTAVSKKLRYRLACLSARSKLPILGTHPKLAPRALSRARNAFRISRILLDCGHTVDENVRKYSMSKADAIYIFIKENSGVLKHRIVELKAKTIITSCGNPQASNLTKQQI